MKGSRYEIGRKYVQRNLGVDMIKYIIYIYEAIKCCINFKVHSQNLSARIQTKYTGHKKENISRKIGLGKLLITESDFMMAVNLLETQNQGIHGFLLLLGFIPTICIISSSATSLQTSSSTGHIILLLLKLLFSDRS